jgi:hypothetical protein
LQLTMLDLIKPEQIALLAGPSFKEQDAKWR